MTTEEESLYASVSRLLKDICDFLSDESARSGKNSKRMASELIARAESQLREIDRVTRPDASYIDMEQSRPPNEEYVDPDFQVPTPIVPKRSRPVNDSTEICPYLNLPAKAIPDHELSYFIYRQEKVFLMFFAQKRIFLGLCKNWLLLYSSDKDSKPGEVVDVRKYAVAESDVNKFAFELRELQGIKVYTFTASCSKDRNQWVAKIRERATRTIDDNDHNGKEEIYSEPEDIDGAAKPKVFKELGKTTNLIRTTPLPSIPTPDEIEVYDCVGSKEKDEIEDPNDNIYECPNVFDKPNVKNEEEDVYDCVGNPNGMAVFGEGHKTPPPLPFKPKLIPKSFKSGLI